MQRKRNKALELEYSIIMPVWNRGNFLESALKSLRRIDYPEDRFELIIPVVHDDTGSKNIIQEEMMTSAMTTILIPCLGIHRSKMLNAACRAAKGQILVFTEDDCVFPESWLKILSQVIEKEPSFGIIGGQDDFEFNDNTPFNLALDCVLKSFVGSGSVRRESTLRTGKFYPKYWNMVIPLEIANNVAIPVLNGLPQIFNESLDVYQDVDLGKRIAQAGWRIVFAPEFRVRHYRAATLRRFIKREFSRARTGRSLKVHRFPHLALTLFTCGLATLFITSFFSFLMAKLLFAVLGSYLAILLMVSFKGFFQTKSVKVFAIIPVLLLILHFGRGIGYLFPLRVKLIVKPEAKISLYKPGW